MLPEPESTATVALLAGIVKLPLPRLPSPQPATIALPTTNPAAIADATAAQPWPAELAQQMQTVRAVVAQAAAPVTAAQVAARFRRTRAAQVQPPLAGENVRPTRANSSLR